MPVNNGYPFLQAFWNSPQVSNPGTAVSDSSSTGSAAWSNPSNVQGQEGSVASASIGASGFGSDDDYSEYLWATNFNFTIPDGATIRGIIAEFDKSVTSGVAKDWKVQIIKGGSVGSTNKADTVTDWGTDTNEYTQHGGETDLWDETWTPADINASNFGVAIAAEGDPADLSNAQIDHILIRVYYDLPVTAEFTFDAYIKQVFTETFTTDAYIKDIKTEAITFDSYVAERYYETFTLDGIVVERNTITVTLDAILVEKTQAGILFDAIIVERLEKDFTLDGIVVERIAETFDIDGIIVERLTETFEYDAYVKGIQDKTFTFDAIVVERTPGGVFTFDAYLKAVDYYVLDDLILPRPKSFKRGFIVTKTDMMTLGGRTGRDIISRKERFVLGWEYLSKTEIDAILEKVELNTPLNFRVFDRVLTIDDTTVIPYVASINYNIPGSNYIGSLELELIEES